MHVLRAFGVATVLLLGVAAQEPDVAHLQRLLADGGVQTSFPDGSPGSGAGRHAAPGRAPARRGGRPRESWPSRGLSMPPGLAEVVLWGSVAIAVAVLVVSLLRRSGDRVDAKQAAPRRAVGVGRVMPATGDDVPDHEQKARAGDFVAALRALLQRALWVARDATGELPLHATGREMLRRLRRHPVPVEPLAHLVAVVERVHFGGRAADLRDYEESRARLSQWEAAWAQRR